MDDFQRMTIIELRNLYAATIADNAALRAAINEVFPALDDAHDYISDAVGRHMRELGITTLKNKAASDRMVQDLKNVEDTQTMLRAALARAAK